MNPITIITKKRDQQILTTEELAFIAQGAATGTIPDYQLAAWLMAVYINGLTDQETADLTRAMAESGDRVDLSGLPTPWADKHSTGGVGDKTTIVLLPILAACGLTVVKMSGPGLGKTGGTIDKLASIPGFRTDLTPEQMKAQANHIGIALTGQTPSLAPADKTLYALRDVTATVPCLPLIVSSILSKKIAGGADHVTLDVKCGSGAFMETPAEARRLADALTKVGTAAGLKIRTAVTDMDQPLGRTAGNALEIKEAIRILQGQETGRFRDLCIHLAQITLENCGILADPAFAIDSGAALMKMRQWVTAQGGSTEIFDHEEWQSASHIHEVLHLDEPGWIKSIDAEIVGLQVVELGGGRKAKGDPIDYTVGIETLVQIGDQIQTNQPQFRVHAATPESAEATSNALSTAYKVSQEKVEPRNVIIQ